MQFWGSRKAPRGRRRFARSNVLSAAWNAPRTRRQSPEAPGGSARGRGARARTTRDWRRERGENAEGRVWWGRSHAPPSGGGRSRRRERLAAAAFPRDASRGSRRRGGRWRGGDRGRPRGGPVVSRGARNPERELRLDNPENRGEPQRRDRAGQPKRRRFGVARRPRRTYRRFRVEECRLAATGPRGFRRPPLRRGAHTGWFRGVLPRQTSFVRPCVPTLHSEAHRASRAYRSFCLCPRGIRHQVRLRPSIPPSVRLGLSRTSIRSRPRDAFTSAIRTTGGTRSPTDARPPSVAAIRPPNIHGLHSSATAKARPSARKKAGPHHTHPNPSSSASPREPDVPTDNLPPGTLACRQTSRSSSSQPSSSPRRHVCSFIAVRRRRSRV